METEFSLDISAGKGAFGDGSHPSTRLAIEALRSLSSLAGVSIALDIGCGSGLLALQMAYQWHVPVWASDINEAAVMATRQNAQENALDALVHARQASGLNHPDIMNAAPFDVITANLLADIHTELAGGLTHHLKSEGIAILSGIMQARQNDIIEIYQILGMTLLQRLTLSGWVTLTLQKA